MPLSEDEQRILRQIEEQVGIAEFNRQCLESAFIRDAYEGL